MWFFNTFGGILALILTGLVSGTLAYLLMHLGGFDEE
jgi:hypothetical protein